MKTLTKAKRADDDDLDALPDLSDGVALAAPVPAVVPPPGIPGVPDPEANPALIDARARHTAVRADLDATDARVAAISGELGIPANSTRGRFEAVMIDLIAAGRDTGTIEQLKSAAERAKLLRSAAEKTAGRVLAALDAARTVAAREAAALVYLPAEREMAAAILAVTVAAQKYTRVLDDLRAAGLAGAISRIIPGDFALNHRDNYALCQCVKAGHLDRDEVRRLLPELQIA